MRSAIVCVDDDPIVLASLGEQLSRGLGLEYDVELAAGASEALDLLAELDEEGIAVPVIISDQRMSGISGAQLLARVHQLYPKTLSILLTGESSVEDVARAVNTAHLYRYIPKPWDETDLLLTVKEALRRYSQEQELSIQRQALTEANFRLEKSLSLLQATLESTADGILVVDNEGVVTHCNQKILDLWGLDPHLSTSTLGPEVLTAITSQLQDPQQFFRRMHQSQAALPQLSGGLEGYDTLTLKNRLGVEFSGYYRTPCGRATDSLSGPLRLFNRAL
jgi:CheY-like chemotaxis protein